MHRVGSMARLWTAAAIALLPCLIAAAGADNHRLREQVRQRQSIIDAELRTVQQQTRDAEFGGRLYWELRRHAGALEAERSSLRSLDSALRSGREQEIERRYADYLRAQQETMRRGRELARVRASEQSFGSRDWHDNQRLANALQRQGSTTSAFGPEYRRALEAQIRVLENRRSGVSFGSAQWHALNRQISALRNALRSVR